MPVTINTGDRQWKAGTFDAVTNLTQSTATSRQTIAPYGITTLSGGTATGIGVDLYTVRGTGTATGGPAVEGAEIWIYMLGTGEAKVVFESMATGRTGVPEIATATVTAPQSVWTSASATGAFTMSLKGHWLHAKFMNQLWQVLDGAATYATAT